nr:4'-phosphopantetheinyl transferase superfamily protein [Halomonas piscis]
MTGIGEVRPRQRIAVGDRVQLWWCRTVDLAEMTAVELSRRWLSARERQQAENFVFDRDRRQYRVSHTLLRRVLYLHTGIAEPRIQFWCSSRGRPFLAPLPGDPPDGENELDFNLSHTPGGNAVAVAAGRRIGVDVERLDHREGRTLGRIADAFSPQERWWLDDLPEAERAASALRLWTLKEAYTKARGLGLSLPFDSFAFVFDADRALRAFHPPQDDASGRWQFLELELAGSIRLAVAVEVVGRPIAHANLREGFPWFPDHPRVLTMPAPTPAFCPSTAPAAEKPLCAARLRPSLDRGEPLS